MKSYGDILKIPGLRRLMAASIPADLADWLDYVAIIALVVYGWQQGPFALALLTVAISLPALLVGPFTAVLVDRADLRLALVIANAGRALTTFMLIFAPSLWVLLPIVFARGCIDSAFTPARQAALQALTPPALNGPANGMVFAINQTTKIAGTSTGGALLVVASPPLVFGVNTALSLGAAAILFFIAIPARPPWSAPPLAEAPAGFREFLRNPRLLQVLVFMVLGWAFAFLYDTLIAVLVQDFGFDEAVFGYVIAASGFGGVVGALLAGLVRMRRDLPWMGLGALVSGPLTVLIGIWRLPAGRRRSGSSSASSFASASPPASCWCPIGRRCSAKPHPTASPACSPRPRPSSSSSSSFPPLSAAPSLRFSASAAPPLPSAAPGWSRSASPQSPSGSHNNPLVTPICYDGVVPREAGMSLKVELKPHERVIVGNCVITNSDQRARLFIDGNSPILREKDILTPATANSPASRVYLAVQIMYLEENIEATRADYFTLVGDIVAAAPSCIPLIDEINNEILTGNLYKALKAARRLIQHEQDILSNAAPGGLGI